MKGRAHIDGHYKEMKEKIIDKVPRVMHDKMKLVN